MRKTKPNVSKIEGPSDPSPRTAVLDRRYALRFAFAATAQALDLENGERVSGETADLSLGGCFVCTSRPLRLRARVVLQLTRAKEIIEILATVRSVKPGAGMGLEFLDLEPDQFAILQKWVSQLRPE